ncbi:hypothetical protein QFZ82_000726 [Streptomyces sp. V4I23]|uniref:hypothetical protein n=1 Tax=Streptomyces sp. V4I23 TaxID=3042282 RepID=UPI0027830D6D|nr:hypothetical protein [Streptomyces sp. V4I23]MDQ1006241.1 hypothetical protein [Streptomyces sp. V4I23]
MSESGFDYCLDDYLFGREFTPEALVEHRDTAEGYDDAAERDNALSAMREIVSRHG